MQIKAWNVICCTLKISLHCTAKTQFHANAIKHQTVFVQGNLLPAFRCLIFCLNWNHATGFLFVVYNVNFACIKCIWCYERSGNGFIYSVLLRFIYFSIIFFVFFFCIWIGLTCEHRDGFMFILHATHITSIESNSVSDCFKWKTVRWLVESVLKFNDRCSQ